jgi:DNA-binding XRE family transcriptional regulator
MINDMRKAPEHAAIDDGEDFLDELIRTRSLRNPRFPSLVEAASARRALLGALAEARAESGLTQTEAAALMGTSQSQVARLESGRADVKLSTVERLAATVGKRIEWKLVDAR